MSNCISLISCDGLCPDIHNIKDPSRSNLLPYLNTLVQINGNVDCTYVVKEPLLVGFQMDSIEFLCDLSQPNGLNAYGSVSYSVNSVTYNGNEFINTPNFPSYTIDPNSFDCLDCDTDSLLCVGNTTNSNNSNAHSQNLTNILLSLGLNIQVFPYSDNGSFVFRIYENDSFTIEIERTSIPNPGVYQFFYVNGTLSLNFNGINITTNLINDDTNTCATRRTGYEVTTFSAVSTCGVVNNYGDYVTVNECDVITIFPMGVTCSVVNTFGRTGSTRSATLVVTGGTPPYNFLWENGNTTGTIINLPSGTDNAVVTDAFGDFVVNTSCFLPPVDCTQITINTNISYTCQVNSSYSQTGFAFLSLIPSGGFGPYTFSGSINNVVTTITDGMLLNNGDLLNIVVFDTNGCSSDVEFLGIVCPPGPTPTPPPFDPLPCLSSILCPNSNLFTLDISASTIDLNFGITPPSYVYEFNFILSSSNYTGDVVGSYKIFNVDLPNSFLRTITSNSSFPNNINNTMYWDGALGTPEVSLNDYVEFGFTELTPINPTNSDSPWNVTYYPYSELNPGYTPTYSWVPGSTSIQLAVALFDDDYCVHKGTTTITIPTDGNTNTVTISF
jgi:hypothetical protein